MHLFSKPANDKQIELLYSIHTDVPNVITTDPIRLRQIITNLVNNAIKFTEKGEVFLGLEVESMTGTHVTLHGWVKDTGIGMTVEQQQRI